MATKASIAKREFISLRKFLGKIPEDIRGKYENVAELECCLTFTWESTSNIITITFDDKLATYAVKWAKNGGDAKTISLEYVHPQAPLLFFAYFVFKKLNQSNYPLVTNLLRSYVEQFVMSNFDKPHLISEIMMDSLQGMNSVLTQPQLLSNIMICKLIFNLNLSELSEIEELVNNVVKSLEEIQQEHEASKEAMGVEEANDKLVEAKIEVELANKKLFKKKLRLMIQRAYISTCYNIFADVLIKDLERCKDVKDGTLKLSYIGSELHVSYKVEPINGRCPICCLTVLPNVEFVIVKKTVGLEDGGDRLPLQIQVSNPGSWQSSLTKDIETHAENILLSSKSEDLGDFLSQSANQILKDHFLLTCIHKAKL